MNTDTPETQAATYKSANGDGEEIPGADYVEANIALRLEQQRNDAMAKLNAANERIAKLEDALSSIQEYWNRDNNDKAMEDACWHAVNTAAEALEAKEAKP